MKKNIATERTSDNIKQVLQVLSDSPVRLNRLSRDLPANKYHEPLGKGERSFAQGLAHLLNGEARSSEGILLAVMKNEPLLADIHPEKDWGKLLQYEELPMPELLTYFEVRRKILLRVLGSLDENQWSRSVRESGKKRMESVYWQARSLALHEVEHLDDLEIKVERLK